VLQAAQLAQRLWKCVQLQAVLEHQLLQLLQAADAIWQRAQRLAALQLQPLQGRQAACILGTGRRMSGLLQHAKTIV
jgi:hypothetical protein